MKYADDRKNVRIYRAKRLSQWQMTFHPGEVHSLFDEIIHRRWGRAKWQPRIDILKIASGYVVEADIPGVDEESVEIGVRGSCLTIEGRRPTSRSEGRAGVLVFERPHGPFMRVIRFGEVIEGFRLQKSMARGVLTVVLTKA